jgi:hypothetical protein
LGDIVKHKHCELIKLWADGAGIQWRRQGCNDWEDIIDPSWVDTIEYRVKPETVRYRVAICRYGPEHYPALIRSERDADYMEKHNSEFVKWIHAGWQETEV